MALRLPVAAGVLAAVLVLLGGAVRGSPAPNATAIDGARLVAASLVTDTPPAVTASVVAPVADAPAPPTESLPAPKAAPASAAFDVMAHVWQTLNNCGPASVVMALSTFGVRVDQETARLALRGPDVRRGMGPQGVDAWVKANFGLRSVWRNDGTNDLMRRLVANGFAPMVTQWMQDPSISRVAHWRTVRGYDDAAGVFYVNDPMLGNTVPLAYDWFGRNWQSFSYRYMVIYRPEDEALLRAIVGRDWSDTYVRQSLYERARDEARAQDTAFAWLAYGEAAYANGVFDEAVTAFERGMTMGSATGVFGVRNSYPQALRALGRRQDADAVAQKLAGITPVPATVAPPPDLYAVFLALRRQVPLDSLPTE